MFRELQMNPFSWKRCNSDAKSHIANTYGAFHKPELRTVLGTTAELLRMPYAKFQPLICSTMDDETYLLRRHDPGYGPTVAPRNDSPNGSQKDLKKNQNNFWGENDGRMSKSKSLFLGHFKGLEGMGVCGNHWKWSQFRATIFKYLCFTH